LPDHTRGRQQAGGFTLFVARCGVHQGPRVR
jgi:hypothetical protein